MYRALYRKWRPAAFSDVVGQEGVTTALKNITHKMLAVPGTKIGRAHV